MKTSFSSNAECKSHEKSVKKQSQLFFMCFLRNDTEKLFKSSFDNCYNQVTLPVLYLPLNSLLKQESCDIIVHINCYGISSVTNMYKSFFMIRYCYEKQIFYFWRKQNPLLLGRLVLFRS